jgi:hypothetical protein
MVIKASAAAEIRPLIEALCGSDDVMREAAIARLAVIGGRAVDGLLAAYRRTNDPSGRAAILRALEPIGDRRAVDVAQQAIAEGGDVAVSAAAVLRGLLDSTHRSAATAALDTLVATALDPAAARRVRVAAFEALQDMPAGVRATLGEALSADSEGLAPHAAHVPQDAGSADAQWVEASSGRLPDDPGLLRALVQTRGSSVALSALQRMIEAARGKERDAREPEMVAAWLDARGTVHQTLAVRGSKVALYDLRETFEHAEAPLPVSFLSAVQTLGDASCLEPLAAAYARARGGDTWWRHQLVAAFRAICARERITRRHAALKRVAAKWPGSELL